MSRFTLLCSLVLGLSSSTLLVSRAEAQFAKAPPLAGHVVMADTTAPVVAPRPSELPVAPDVIVDRAAVRTALAKARAKNLGWFRQYQKNGVFPSNTYQARKLNVWLDREGHYCAAATIMQMSGNAVLAQRIADENNFIRLGDVTDGPVLDWILTSGLTQAEIAMIQEPFMPVVEEPGPDPVLAHATLRAQEDARLRAKYRAVDRELVKHAKRNLEQAVDRLMQHPALARQLVDRQG